MTSGLEAHNRLYLEKLSLAAEVLLRAGEEEPEFVNSALESELHWLRTRIERALLLSPDVPET